MALGGGRLFRSGRQFAASLGLVPRQEGTSGKTKLMGTPKDDDAYLRGNLVHGARSSIFWRMRREGPRALRLQAQERSINVVAMAIADRLIVSRRLYLADVMFAGRSDGNLSG